MLEVRIKAATAELSRIHPEVDESGQCRRRRRRRPWEETCLLVFHLGLQLERESADLLRDTYTEAAEQQAN